MCVCVLDFSLVRLQFWFRYGTYLQFLPLLRCTLSWKTGGPPSAEWGSEMGNSETSLICLGSIKDMYALNAVPRNCFVLEGFLLILTESILFW